MTKNHVGKYTCQLTQKVSVKMAHSVVKLLPLSKPSILVSKRRWFTTPRITRGKTVISIGDSIIANLKKTLVITCQCTGVPDPTREWKFNGNPINDLTDLSGLKVLRDGDLEVTVEWKHNGMFECYSVNMMGSDSAYTKITVYGEKTPTQYIPPSRNRRLLTLLTRPYSVSIGTNITSRAENSLLLKCPVSRTDEIKSFWMKNGVVLHHAKQVKQSLLLERVSKKDRGRYTCVSDDPAKVKFGSVNLIVLEPLKDLFVIKPTIITKKQRTKVVASKVQETDVGVNVKALTGGVIKLKCLLKSTENVRITWLKNGRTLKPNSKDIVVGNTLIIKDTEQRGNFTYTCSLSGLLGSAKQTSNVEIIEFVPIQILSEKGDVDLADPMDIGEIVVGKTVAAIPGVSITLTCPLVGIPKPTITWYYNTRKLEKGRKDVIIAKMSNKYIGKYTCVATQGNRSVTAITNIKILAMSKPEILHSNATVVSNPDSKSTVFVNIGDTLAINLYKKLMIHCSASGRPSPKAVWLFNGKPISLVQNVVEMTNGSLAITSVLWTHNGLFECFQMNSIGLDAGASEVKVYGRYTPTKYVPPKKTVRVLTIRNMPVPVAIGATIFVRSSNSLSLKCPVQQHGPVGITWYKDGKLVRYGRQYKLQDLHVGDSGAYDCHSNDHANLKFGTIFVNVLEPVEELMIAPFLKKVEFLHYSTQGQEATVGSDVTMITRNKIRFTCPLKSKINVNITWLVNGDHDLSNQKFVVEGNVLRVKSTQKESVDNITCHVSSLLGSAQLSSKLHIVAPSRVHMRKIEQKLILLKLQEEFEVGGSVEVRHGSSMRMKCPASGVPPPDIQWMYNDQRVTKEGNNLGVNIIEEDKVLFIPLVQQSHSGLYKCIASGTDGGVNVAAVTVDVYEPMSPEIIVQYKQSDDDEENQEILGRDGLFLTSSSSVLIVRGMRKRFTKEIGRDYKLLSGLILNLTCPTRGRPKPSIIWTKNGTEVGKDVDHFLISTKDASSSGLYRCTATNIFGSVTKASSVQTIVPRKPVIRRKTETTNKAEYLARKVQVVIGDNLETIIGTTVTIRCPVIAIPRAKITYYKDGKVLKYNAHLSFDSDDGSLLFSPATIHNSGVYTCNAENEAGSIELSTKLELYHDSKPRILPPKAAVAFNYSANSTRGNLTIYVGQSAVAYPKTQAVFKCPVKGFPPPTITWVKDTKILSEIKGGSGKDTSLVHHLRDGHDDGEYICTATNTAGSVTRKVVINMKTPLSAHIIITSLSTVLSNNMTEAITIGQHVNILLESSLTIHCPSNGEPIPKHHWSISTKPRGWLEAQDNVNISASGDRITIHQMTKTFSGIYSCKVVNIFGSDQRFSNLLVKDVYPATISSSDKTVIAQIDHHELTALIGEKLYVRPNTRVLIQCPVNGMPYPTVTWMRNKKILTSHIDMDTNTLTLPRVGFEDAGIYTCIAHNIMNTAKNSTKLHVGVHPHIEAVPSDMSPIIAVTPYSEVTIPVGVAEAFVRSESSASFQCKGKGHPDPSIVWFRNGVGIDYKKGQQKYQSLIPSVLEVKKLSRDDSGIYSCMVKNAFGMLIKRTKLEVLEPPVIQTSKSNITFFTSPRVKITVGGGIIVLKGATVTLRCPATGRPKPSIHWLEPKAKTASSDGRLNVNEEKQLTIQNIQTSDSGKYICTASNKVASTSSFMRLLVADAPSADILPNYGGEDGGEDKAVLDDEGKLIVPGGSPIRLFCRIIGSPTPRVTWLKDHTIVRPSNKYKVDKGSLEVRDSEPSDAGTYVCMVENLLGVTTVPIKVVIGAPPQISKSIFLRRKEEGRLVEAFIGSELRVRRMSSVKLYCNATALPPPTMTWQISEFDVQLERTVVRNLSAESGVLILHNVTEDVVGNITCIATNIIGTDKVTSNLHVLDPPEIISDVKNVKNLATGRYVVMGRTKHLHILQGESIKLVCVANGSPYPTITFSHQREKFTGEQMFRVLQNSKENTPNTVEDMMSPKASKLHDVHSETMQITRRSGHKFLAMVAVATVNDITLLKKDVYSCKASNTAGTDQRQIRLHVHPKPRRPYTGTWVSSSNNFSACSTPCIRPDYGTRTRKVICLTYEGKITDAGWCGVNWKPKASIECPTMQCRAEWSTGIWSKCSASCGRRGMQERSVRCVYAKGKVESSEKNCHQLRMKPVHRRRCNQFPCSQDLCVDKHSYCKHMHKMGFCSQQKYKTLCCATCSKTRDR